MRAAVGLSEGLETDVTAEGVEDERQLAALRREGCGEVQGYLIGRPVRAADVRALLRRRASRGAVARLAGAAGTPALPEVA